MKAERTLDEATSSYEAWVDRHTPTLADARADKHALMATGPFPFLRATYYRWAAMAVNLPTPAGPVVGAVGDLHVENFGTWRDGEARLTRADVQALLVAMGAETATVHLATATAGDLTALTTKAAQRWLRAATQHMVQATVAEAALWQRLHAKRVCEQG